MGIALENESRVVAALRDLSEAIHDLAVAKGWWTKELKLTPQSGETAHVGLSWEDRFSECCMNITGEVSELYEAYRANKLDAPCDKKDTGLTCAEEELADIIIRTLDLASAMNVDIGEAILKKHEYNKSRSYRHGNKRA